MSSRRPSTLLMAAIVLLLLTTVAAQAAPFHVTSTADSGANTLRQAILDSNAAGPGPNLIDFTIPGAGVHTITVLTNLPTVTVPVNIDATTQPGFVPNTLAVGDNEVPQIELTNTLSLPNGLFFTGGNSSVKGMVISGFVTNVAFMTLGSNSVKACFIGTNATGTAAATTPGSVGVGVVSGVGNVIGGDNLADRNIISACSGENIELLPDTPVTGTGIFNNYIGTDAAGTTVLGTTAYGILIVSTNNRVGSDGGDESETAHPGNVIAGATIAGIRIQGPTAAGNQVEKNLIGTDATGLVGLPNGTGVVINLASTGNEIGEGNVIAFNTGDGVNVDGVGTIDNTITANSIFSNGGPGIDLTNTGNNSLPAPVLTGATNQFGETAISGTLTVVAQPTAQFIIEFFSDPVNEAGGKVFLGSKVVTTDGSGFVAFSAVFPGAVPTGQFITATATDAAGNTSQFSNAVTVGPAPDLVVKKVALSSPVQAGSNVTYMINIANRGNVAAANVVLTDVLPATLSFVTCSTTVGTCGAVLQTVTATIGTLNPGASANVAIVAKVLTSDADNSVINNTATATTTTQEPNTTNNTSTASIVVSNNTTNPPLIINTDLVSGNLFPAPGSVQTYVFKVTLRANKSIYGVTATGNAPGLQGNPVPSLGTVNVSGMISNPLITWRITTMTAGQVATLLVTEKRTIPANAPNGSLFTITGPWSATYYYAASKPTAGPTPALTATVTTP